jgi:hypothetical protein
MALGADTAQLAVNLNLTGNFNRDIGKVQAQIKGTAKSVESFQSKAKNSILAGVGLGAGVTGFTLASQAIAGVIDAGLGAIDMASDLEESQSKVNVVFGEGADEVSDWARAADQALGLTEAAALEAAGTFGNFLQALGSTQGAAQDMSLQMVELAADLASFNNTDINEVIIALRSGLAGEAEPLRRLGVSLSAAREEAFLTARGIQKVNGVFRDADKVMARYSLIMEDTTLAQGDFARTSEGFANSARKFQAALGDLATAAGGFLIGPAMGVIDFFQRVVNALSGSGNGTDKVKEFAAAIRETDDAMEELDATVNAWEPITEADFVGEAPIMKIARALIPMANQLNITRDELHVMATDAFLLNNNLNELDETIASVADDMEKMLANPDRFKQLGGGAANAASRFAVLNRSTGAAGDAAAEMAGDYAQAARRVEGASEHIVKTIADLPGSIKDEIKSGRKAVQEAFQDLRFAMEHPFAGRKFENFLRDKQKAALRKHHEAMQAGNTQAAADAWAIYESITGTLGQLDDQRYNVRVNIGYRGIGGLGGAPGNVGQNHQGGVLYPGQWGTMGERGPERVANRGGVTVIEPMQSPKPGGRTVIVRPVITAFQVGRELGRAATTRRSGAGVL